MQSLHQCTSLFVVVRGKIRFETPLGVHELSEGSSLAFETSKDVLYIEPSSPVGFDGVPPRVMIVRLGMIELKTRRDRGGGGLERGEKVADALDAATDVEEKRKAPP